MSNNRPKNEEEAQKRIDEYYKVEDNQSQSLHESLGWTKDELMRFQESGQIPDPELRPMNE